jgi:hypothetical protein
VFRPWTEHPPIHSAASLGDPQQVDAGRLVRHGRPDLEPERRPQWPEGVAQRGIVVLEPFGLIRRDAIDRAGHPQHVGIARVRPDPGADPLADLRDAVAGVPGVALHARAT